MRTKKTKQAASTPPPEPRPAPTFCGDSEDDYVCTKPKGHAGPHVAHVPATGRDVAAWSNRADYAAPAAASPPVAMADDDELIFPALPTKRLDLHAKCRADLAALRSALRALAEDFSRYMDGFEAKPHEIEVLETVVERLRALVGPN